MADAWRSLSESERHYWTEQERNDKLRYVQEKEQHQGPWEQPKRRAKKHPLAPKRPMSAFLKYSKTRRREVKEDNPDMSNTDISRLLGEMWRNASPEECRPYREQEEKERAVYKAEIAKWRADQARIEQERALSMPSTSSTSETRLNAGREDIARQQHHLASYDAKVPRVPYEYAKSTNPLNHHDPNGSHFNEPHPSNGNEYSEAARRGDNYDYSYTYHRPDYRHQHYHHDQYRHQPHHNGTSSDASAYSHGNSGPNEAGGYSDFRRHYHAPHSSHHYHSRPSQEGGSQYSYTYDSGTSGKFLSSTFWPVIHALLLLCNLCHHKRSCCCFLSASFFRTVRVALLAAAASDGVDQHDDHSEKYQGKDSYHFSFSAATDGRPTSETSHLEGDKKSECEFYANLPQLVENWC